MAILYFHWGREHVWFPPSANIALAKELLDDDRVALIVGMHPHRVQGCIEHNGKRAYMCLGNFLFPNFFISPPTQICYPAEAPEKFDITRQYHTVDKITYKKWRFVNRVSMILSFDSNACNVNHRLVIQSDDMPVVSELRGFSRLFMNLFIDCLSLLYRLPPRIYIKLERLSTFLSSNIWRSRVFLFRMKQLGFFAAQKRLVSKLRQRGG
jgi:poly-gamma-glutamate synthesis protein (capsule biosynthesis protein)